MLANNNPCGGDTSVLPYVPDTQTGRLHFVDDDSCGISHADILMVPFFFAVLMSTWWSKAIW